MHEAGDEGSHHIQVREVVHQFSLLHKVVEVPGDIDAPENIMVGVVFIEAALDGGEEAREVVIGYRELIQKSILLEQFEPKVQNGGILEDLIVFEDVEFPLVEVIHHLEGIVPHAGGHIDHLLDPLFLLLELVGVRLLGLSVDFLQEVVQVPFEPLGGVVGAFRGHVEPGLGLHVHVLLLGGHVEVQLVELVALNDLDRPLRLLLYALTDVPQLHHLVQDLDHRLHWVQVLVRVPQLALVPRDLADGNHHHTDQPQHPEPPLDDPHDPQNQRRHHYHRVETVEEVHQVHEVGGEGLQQDLGQEDVQEVLVYSGQHLISHSDQVSEGEPEEDEQGVDGDQGEGEGLKEGRLQHLQTKKLQPGDLVFCFRGSEDFGGEVVFFVDGEVHEPADDDHVDEGEDQDLLELLQHEGVGEHGQDHPRAPIVEGDGEVVGGLGQDEAEDEDQQQLHRQDLAVLLGAFLVRDLHPEEDDAEDFEDDLGGVAGEDGEDHDEGVEGHVGLIRDSDFVVEDGGLAAGVGVETEDLVPLTR
mmetsp:Transcript_39264/g.37688  ORF Transcript_39264/g.37688 Transcript_39264/m.37688 type:complete len:528 (-) Transcript_39264:121-1704(-)